MLMDAPATGVTVASVSGGFLFGVRGASGLRGRRTAPARVGRAPPRPTRGGLDGGRRDARSSPGGLGHAETARRVRAKARGARRVRRARRGTSPTSPRRAATAPRRTTPTRAPRPMAAAVLVRHRQRPSRTPPATLVALAALALRAGSPRPPVARVVPPLRPGRGRRLPWLGPCACYVSRAPGYAAAEGVRQGPQRSPPGTSPAVPRRSKNGSTQVLTQKPFGSRELADDGQRWRRGAAATGRCVGSRFSLGRREARRARHRREGCRAAPRHHRGGTPPSILAARAERNGGSRGPGSRSGCTRRCSSRCAGRNTARRAGWARVACARASGLATSPSGCSARAPALAHPREGPARRRRVVVRRPDELVGHAVPAVAHRQHPRCAIGTRAAGMHRVPARARRQARRVEHVGPRVRAPQRRRLGETSVAAVGRHRARPVELVVVLRVVAAGRARSLASHTSREEDLRLRPPPSARSARCTRPPGPLKAEQRRGT